MRYDKVTRKEKIFKEYIGSVALTNGQYLFAPNDKYLLSLQKADELRESLEKKRELSHLTEALDKSIEKHQADPRCLGMITYPLKYILLVVLLAAMNGIRDCKGAAIYWVENREWFVRNFEDFPDKDISHDTIRRLLCLLNESKTEAIFNELVSPILKARIQEKSERTLALDSQAVLASRVGSKTPYLLNVYDATNGVAITTELVDKKTNEMTVAPRLIRKLLVDTPYGQLDDTPGIQVKERNSCYLNYKVSSILQRVKRASTPVCIPGESRSERAEPFLASF